MYSARVDNVDDAVGPSSFSVSSAGNGITSALRLEHAEKISNMVAVTLLAAVNRPCGLNSGK
jgi:hypothetical protein